VILYPAIDILGGNAVRLLKGAFDAKKVYDEEPLQAAERWVQAGAQALHVVDLDGAKAGEPVNIDQLRLIAGELAVPVQYGGGLRTLQAIERALEAGAQRAILGTAALTDPELLERSLSSWPGRLLVSVDARAGEASTAGWTLGSGVGASAAIADLCGRGVDRFVYTNVDRDGMLQGPDLEEVGGVARAVGRSSFVYSGGIGEAADLRALAALNEPSLHGVIVGKALYERRFTVAEALAALRA
jgi:phosphoribosylformimino-5-aminoimidazole carboxamide ribotide isomerase